MPIEFASPGTVLEIESEPLSPVTVHGRGNRIRIGRNVRLNASIWIRGDNSLLEIGDDCDIHGLIHVVRGGAIIRIGRGTSSTGLAIATHEPGEITIGEDCMFSEEVRMDVSDVHPIYDAKTGERLNPPKPIVIGDRVWLATRVLVMKGAEIGDGTIVGAGSIVVGKLPAGCIAAGSPARPLRKDVVWRRDFNELAIAPEGGRSPSPAGPLPEGFQPQTVAPFPGGPPAAVTGSQISREELMGVRLEELAAGVSDGLTRRLEYCPAYLDKAGSAFDPLNNPDAATSGAEPIDLRGFAFDGPARALARGVELVIDGVAYAARYGLWRADVAKSQDDGALGGCGFVLTLAPQALAAGPHTVSVRVIGADGRGYYEGPEHSFKVLDPL
jgi:acetyltransferase-like isoleucine patch superfamily enzyme